MKRLLALAAVAMLALTGVAVANHKGAKVYRAKLAAVGAATVTGKSHLVDGKKNNIVNVHAKGLTAGTAYPWHVHELPVGAPNPCAAGAPQGDIVGAFNPYGELKGNEDGNGSARAKSTTFNWDSTKFYYVNIHDPGTGAPISCGLLTRKTPKPHPKGKQRGFERH